MLKKFIILSIVSLIIFAISIIMHEVAESFLGRKDILFFFIAAFLSPLLFFTGVIGSIVVYVKELKKR